jgi:adenine deaminase
MPFPSSEGSEASERRAAADVAAGAAAADLVVRGGRVVDVYAGRLRTADVAISGRRIAAVGDVSGCVDSSTEVLEAGGLFVLPGYVDPHFHVGGSQLSIEGLAEILVPSGTAALSTCFYEPGFIAGLPAVEELLARSEGTGLEVLLSPFHAATLGMGPFGIGSKLGFDELRRLIEHPRCVEVREWNYATAGIPIPEMGELYETALRERRVIAGHLEGLDASQVQASACLGAASDHEAISAEEALERVAAGVNVQIREGSGARDLEALARAITDHGCDPRRFSFSTDEQELHSLVEDGHIDHKLRRAVALGIAPIDAVRMATLGAAESMAVARDFGSVAPGRVASLAVVDDLSAFRSAFTLSAGRLSSERGVYGLDVRREPYPAEWKQTVRVDRRLGPDDFALDLPDGRTTLRVIGVTPGLLVTDELEESVEITGGRINDAAPGIAKMAVIDRYEGGAHAAVGLIRGLGVERGAIAATVNPGVMNLMVLGTDEEAMAVAANRVVELGGGISVASEGEIRAEVALPLFGILSDEPAYDTAAACREVAEAIRVDVGCAWDGVLSNAGFACLAVSIPSLKITDRGLVRVARDGHEAVPLAVDAELEEVTV